jgi:hypothetical protein
VTVLEEWLLLKVTGKKTRELFNIVKDVPQILPSTKVKKVEYLRPGHLFAILLLRKWDIQGFQ